MEEKDSFLECEKWGIYATLMCVAGFYGAFTYSIRGGIFCNAQTANFVLFAMALGNAQWHHALYYFIPMSAYLLGAIISEAIAGPVKRMLYIRWDTILVFLEMIAVIFLGFLPESAPYQISQEPSILYVPCSTIHFEEHKMFRWQQPFVPIIYDRQGLLW